MRIATKIQIDKKNYEFIKQVYKELDYKSLSEYMRNAINTRVEEDRKWIRRRKRLTAMEMIGIAPHSNLFESIEGDDFDTR